MIETEVDPGRRLAIHTVAGELTMEGILGAMGGLFAHPEFDPGFSVIWDLRQSDLVITLREIIYLDRQLVEFANENRPTGKVAWVPATGFGDSIIKVLYREHPWAQEWRTFSTLDSAIRWATEG